MKNFLQNLLIFFALCLCALIAFQWVRETHLRRDIQALHDTLRQKQEEIQKLNSRLRLDEAEIQRLDGIKNQLTEQVKSNNLQILQLTKDLEKAGLENERNLKQIEVYKQTVQTANENIKRANENIETQKGELKKLADERVELVQKLNKMTTDFNDLAAKWNQQQEELAKRATNAPSKK